MLLFCFFIFRAVSSLFLFNLIFKILILHIFLIIIIIIRYSGMFRNVPCSMFHVPCSMFHVPGFIDALCQLPNKFERENNIYSGVDKTRNMKHSGISRNIPEHPGTSNNYNNYEKVCKIKFSKLKLSKNKLVSARNIKKIYKNKQAKQKHKKKKKMKMN